MKRFALLSALVLLTYTGGATAGTLYNDATGDVIVPGSPFPHIDITSVDVSNTATDLVFKINLNGDPVATDWGKYMVGIDSTAGGDPAGNGWGRPIGMSTGMDYWLGSWVDSGNGMELRTWNGSSWFLQAASYNAIPPLATPTKTTSSVTLTVPLGYLGLGVGDTILFDVYTSGGGGGDGAVDALGNPNPSISDWGTYYNSENTVLSYTVVPEPGTLVLVTLSAVLTTFGLGARRSRSVR
jgi:hypothetical protein